MTQLLDDVLQAAALHLGHSVGMSCQHQSAKHGQTTRAAAAGPDLRLAGLDEAHTGQLADFCNAALYAAPALFFVGIVGRVVVAEDARLPQLPCGAFAYYVSGCVVAGVDAHHPAFLAALHFRLPFLKRDCVFPVPSLLVLVLGPLAGVVALRHDAAGLQLSGCAFCEDFPGLVVLHGVEIRFSHVFSFSCAMAAAAFSSICVSLRIRSPPFPAFRPSCCITARFKNARFCSS